MKTHLVFLVGALAACDHWNQADPTSCRDLVDWQVEMSRVGGAPHEGAEGAAARAPDGSVLVAIHDPFSDVLFGTERLTGAHLARIASDGTIVAREPAAEGNDSHTANAVFAVPDGTFVVEWSGVQSVTLASYDATLQKRWSVVLAGFGFFTPMDVGPRGEVAFVQDLQAPTGTTLTLLYLAPDGTTLWQAPLGQMGLQRVRIADNGDVFAFVNTSDGPRRQRLAAADGALAEDIAIQVLPDLAARDGSFVFANYAPDGSARARVEKFDTSGAMLWSSTFAVRSYNLPLFTDGGDIAALVSYEDPPTFDLVVLDIATGQKRAEPAACGYITPIAVDSDHYVGIGQPGSASVGIASFPMQ